MPVEKIIVYISTFFWLLPPFRQFKGRYFYYFLILALADPINILSISIIGVPNYSVHSIMGLLLFYSIGTGENEKKYMLANMIFMLAFFLFLFLLDNLLYLILTLHLLILYRFLRLSLLNTFSKYELNIFLLMLVFYEISVVVKTIVFISGTNLGVIFFYLTLSFQILVAIFYTIFREDSSPLMLKFRTAPWINFRPFIASKA